MPKTATAPPPPAFTWKFETLHCLHQLANLAEFDAAAVAFEPPAVNPIEEAHRDFADSEPFRRWQRFKRDLETAQALAEQHAARAKALLEEITAAIADGKDPSPLEADYKQHRGDEEISRNRAAILEPMEKRAKAEALKALDARLWAKRDEFFGAALEQVNERAADLAAAIGARLPAFEKARREADYWSRAYSDVERLAKHLPEPN